MLPVAAAGHVGLEMEFPLFPAADAKCRAGHSRGDAVHGGLQLAADALPPNIRWARAMLIAVFTVQFDRISPANRAFHKILAWHLRVPLTRNIVFSKRWN